MWHSGPRRLTQQKTKLFVWSHASTKTYNKHEKDAQSRIGGSSAHNWRAYCFISVRFMKSLQNRTNTTHFIQRGFYGRTKTGR
jgi:hypothetical protein